MRAKVHSPWPFFVLAALFSLVPVLNNKYPASFFPAVPAFWVEVLMSLGGVYAVIIALNRLWAILERATKAKTLVRTAAANRQSPENPDPNDVITAGRYITRLVRNADEDLKEMKPDFTMESLGRLQGYLPELLGEVEDEESAKILLGIVGVYLGETLCRNDHWQWFFKPAPDLKQFIYLASEIHKEGKKADPFALSTEVLTGARSIRDVLKGL